MTADEIRATQDTEISNNDMGALVDVACDQRFWLRECALQLAELNAAVERIGLHPACDCENACACRCHADEDGPRGGFEDNDNDERDE